MGAWAIAKAPAALCVSVRSDFVSAFVWLADLSIATEAATRYQMAGDDVKRGRKCFTPCDVSDSFTSFGLSLRLRSQPTRPPRHLLSLVRLLLSLGWKLGHLEKLADNYPSIQRENRSFSKLYHSKWTFFHDYLFLDELCLRLKQLGRVIVAPTRVLFLQFNSSRD